jgi:hypothetical protein
VKFLPSVAEKRKMYIEQASRFVGSGVVPVRSLQYGELISPPFTLLAPQPPKTNTEKIERKKIIM